MKERPNEFGVVTITAHISRERLSEFIAVLEKFDKRTNDGSHFDADLSKFSANKEEFKEMIRKAAPEKFVAELSEKPLSPIEMIGVIANMIPDFVEVFRKAGEIRFENDRILLLRMLGHSMLDLAQHHEDRLSEIAKAN